jgi:hypothetical protein
VASRKGQRRALVDELSSAHADVARLWEMVTVLKATHGLDPSRLGELMLEWKTASENVKGLSLQLRAIEEEE